MKFLATIWIFYKTICGNTVHLEYFCNTTMNTQQIQTNVHWSNNSIYMAFYLHLLATNPCNHILEEYLGLTQNKCQILLPNLVNDTKTQPLSCIFVLNATKFSKIDRFKTFMSNDVHKADLSVREHLNSYQMDTFVQKPQYHPNLLDQSIQMVTVRSNDPLLTAWTRTNLSF